MNDSVLQNLGKNYNHVIVDFNKCSVYDDKYQNKKIDLTYDGSKVPSGGSSFSPPPEKVSKTPLKLRIAGIATVVGFGMLIGGAISGVVPLVIIGSIIGIIGIICAKFLSVALEEEYYEKASKEFGEKLDKYLNNKNNDIKNEDVYKALDGVTELIEQGNPLDIMEHGTNELANRILTKKNIGKIFRCLKENENEKVKSSAANLIRAALIQNQISKEVKVAIFTRLAKMREHKNNNDNNNNNNILGKYFGKEALNSLKGLESPNKKSAETKQDKNGSQSQIEAKLDEIIDKIKNHTVDN